MDIVQEGKFYIYKNIVNEKSSNVKNIFDNVTPEDYVQNNLPGLKISNVESKISELNEKAKKIESFYNEMLTGKNLDGKTNNFRKTLTEELQKKLDEKTQNQVKITTERLLKGDLAHINEDNIDKVIDEMGNENKIIGTKFISRLNNKSYELKSKVKNTIDAIYDNIEDLNSTDIKKLDSLLRQNEKIKTGVTGVKQRLTRMLNRYGLNNIVDDNSNEGRKHLSYKNRDNARLREDIDFLLAMIDIVGGEGVLYSANSQGIIGEFIAASLPYYILTVVRKESLKQGEDIREYIKKNISGAGGRYIVYDKNSDNGQRYYDSKKDKEKAIYNGKDIDAIIDYHVNKVDVSFKWKDVDPEGKFIGQDIEDKVKLSVKNYSQTSHFTLVSNSPFISFLNYINDPDFVAAYLNSMVIANKKMNENLEKFNSTMEDIIRGVALQGYDKSNIADFFLVFDSSKNKAYCYSTAALLLNSIRNHAKESNFIIKPPLTDINKGINKIATSTTGSNVLDKKMVSDVLGSYKMNVDMHIVNTKIKS